MTLSNEDLLIKKIIGHDTLAFEALYNFYYPALYTFILKLLKSETLAEDLCQEIFLQLWETRETLENIHTFKSYLFTTAKHKALNVLRRSATETAIKSEIVRHYPFLHTRVEDDMTTREYLEHLNVMVNNLSSQSREVFKLCRQEGKSYDEVATILGISKSAVKKHMVKTMASMQTAISTDLGVSLNVFIAILLNA